MKDYHNDLYPAMIDEPYNKFVGSEPKGAISKYQIVQIYQNNV